MLIWILLCVLPLLPTKSPTSVCEQRDHGDKLLLGPIRCNVTPFIISQQLIKSGYVTFEPISFIIAHKLVIIQSFRVIQCTLWYSLRNLFFKYNHYTLYMFIQSIPLQSDITPISHIPTTKKNRFISWSKIRKSEKIL